MGLSLGSIKTISTQLQKACGVENALVRKVPCFSNFKNIKPLELKYARSLQGDVVQFSRFAKPNRTRVEQLLKENGVDFKILDESKGLELFEFRGSRICDNNSIFLEELNRMFPKGEGRTNKKLQQMLVYLEDINHSSYADKKSFLQQFLKDVEKVEKMTNKDGKLLFEGGYTVTKNAILNAKYNNPDRYKEIMDLYKLHQQGKAPEYLLKTLFSGSNFHKLPKSDMTKLLKGEHYFPQLKSIDEKEIAKLTTGEAFSVNQEMFVKTEKGFEKLKINKEVYEKLFPPIQRYAMAQGPLGNCHLMAALDSITKNPQARIDLYKMFEQTENGVKCTIKGYPQNGIAFDFNNLSVLYGKNNLNGSLGHKMIEYSYAKNAYDDLVNSTVCSEWLKEAQIKRIGGDVVKYFDYSGEADNVAEHLTALTGRNSKTVYPRAKNFNQIAFDKTLKEQKGISIGNSVTSSPIEKAGIIDGHFYNTGDLKDKKIINPWNTIEVIDYSPFKLQDITYA